MGHMIVSLWSPRTHFGIWGSSECYDLQARCLSLCQTDSSKALKVFNIMLYFLFSCFAFKKLFGSCYMGPFLNVPRWQSLLGLYQNIGIHGSRKVWHVPWIAVIFYMCCRFVSKSDVIEYQLYLKRVPNFIWSSDIGYFYLLSTDYSLVVTWNCLPVTQERYYCLT